MILVNSGFTANFSDLKIDGAGEQISQAIRHLGDGTVDHVHFANIKYATYLGVGISIREDADVNVLNSMFTNIERIGAHYRGPGVTGTFQGNTYTGKGAGDWIEYAAEAGGGAVIQVLDNTVTGNLGVALSDGSTSAAFLVTDFFGPGTHATFADNAVTNSTAGVAAGYLDTDASIVTFGAGNEFTGGVGTGVAVVGNVVANGTNQVDGTFDWDGGPANNAPSGAGLADTLRGGGGDDTITGFGGADILTGGETGETHGDKAVYNEAIDASEISETATGWTVTSDTEGSDTLSEIEIVDGTEGGRFLLVGNGGFDTIAAAYAEAVDGDTIVLSADTYSENLTIDKAITIAGAQHGVDGALHAGAESIIVGTLTVTLASGAVVIDGVQINNTSDNLTQFKGVVVTSGANVTIENSRFWSTGPNGNNGDRGIELQSGATGTIVIDDNFFGGVQGGTDKFSTANWTSGVWSDGNAAGLTITGNTFDHVRTGLNLDGYDDPTTVVSNNAFANSGSGISIGTPSAGTVTGITNNAFAGVDTDFNLQNVTTGQSFNLDATNNVSTSPLDAMVVLGGSSDDIITGTAGTDILVGNDGADVLDGVNGDDLFIIANSAHHDAGENLIGGGGTDVVRFTSTTAQTLTVQSASVEEIAISDASGVTTGTLAHNIDASAATVTGDVKLTGNDGDNALIGNAGANLIVGNGGNDTLRGNAGDDALQGGAGVDTAAYSGNYSDFTITWDGATAVVTDNVAAGLDEGQDSVTGVGKLVFADKTVWLVNDDAGSEYTTVAQLFDGDGANGEAAAGDIILVAPGTYTDLITVDTDVTIKGAMAGVDGRDAGRGTGETVLTGGVRITHDGVTIDGVEIRGSYDSVGLDGTDTPNALLIKASNVTIENTLFDGTGSELTDARPFSTSTTVTGLEVTHNSFGNWAQGVYIVAGHSGTIEDNDFHDNGNDILTESTSMIISNNSFENSVGSHVASLSNAPSYDASNFILSDNTFSADHLQSVSIYPNASGSQIITGTDYNDSFKGDYPGVGPGPFTFDGGAGSDSIVGGAANDTVIGTADGVNDSYNGNGGTDTIDFSGLTLGQSIVANLGAGAAAGAAIGTDTLSSFENLKSGGGDNSLFGSNVANVIQGGAGADNIVGGGGNDTLFGEADNDTLNGGVNDFVVTPAAANDVLWGGTGIDTFRFEGRFGNDAIGDTVTADWTDGEDIVLVGYVGHTPLIVDVVGGVQITIDDGSVSSEVFVAGANSAQMQVTTVGTDIIIH